jgi:nuclear transport factor 2 (NTF2) superfamily protein
MTGELEAFARDYTEAWCSQDPARVAAHYAPDGSLTINDGEPATGRAAITEAARSFMDAFPDLRVEMDGLRMEGASPEYHWTLVGTNTGPGGTGRQVRISGYEEWKIGADGLIAASLGHYDQADWDRQLEAV